jgi:UDP:flavonoid glycosyltransferase YjiC (YdhE family)
MGFDQTENASRLEELGIGATLSPRNYSVRKLVPTLRELLNSPEVRDACQVAAAHFPGAAVLDSACREIEALGKHPQTADDSKTQKTIFIAG